MKDFKLAFSAIRSAGWAYMKPVVTIFLTKAGQEVLAIAEKFVMQALSNDALKTGAQKRKWVADQIGKADLSTGNSVADSVINLAIEIAVAKMKSVAERS